MTHKLSLAYSPCPNDTFIFFALSSGIVKIGNCEISTFFHDVETLNQSVLKRRYDITKLSFCALLQAENNYKLLNSGAAVGYGSGPLLVSRKPLGKTGLDNCSVAVPGELTTAHLLLQLFYPGIKDKIFTTYDKIFDLVLEGKCDAGVIIHESRFVYPRYGLSKVSDLGELWEKETNLPVPLGCIAAKRTLPADLIPEIESAIKKSIEFSKHNPSELRAFIKKHSIEKDDDIIDKHIKTFVNDFSLDIGEKGLLAYETMRKMAFSRGIIK